MAADSGKVVVISGPSGAGKTSIIRDALRRTGASFGVSVTTRRPRPGEQNGVDYHFVDHKTFQDMVEHGEMLEWAEVYGERYGTPGQPVSETIHSGGTIVLDVDVQGARSVHARLPDAAFVLILPPSDAELARRLRRRHTECEDDIRRRLERAQREIAAARDSGIYGTTVINDDLEQAIRRVVNVIKQEPAIT